MSTRPKVNDLYQPGRPTVPAPKASDSCERPPCSCDGTNEAAVLKKHQDPWTHEQVCAQLHAVCLSGARLQGWRTAGLQRSS